MTRKDRIMVRDLVYIGGGQLGYGGGRTYEHVPTKPKFPPCPYCDNEPGGCCACDHQRPELVENDEK